DPVDMFLFDTQRGFCEHYAGAFAALMRAAGVPSRVVTGYQGGELNPHGLYLIVRQSDAHAWTEVLVDGQWRRIDPTAVVAPSRIEMGMSRALGADEPVPLFARLDGGWLKGAQLTFDAMNHAWRRNLVGFDRQRTRARMGGHRAGAFGPRPREARARAGAVARSLHATLARGPAAPAARR